MAERAQSRGSNERKLAELRRSIDRMIDLVAAGTMAGPAVARRFADAETEAMALENRLEATAPTEVTTLHPKALEYYLKVVRTLSVTLAPGRMTRQ